jgi:filamentous hemagglutinin family protein
MNKLLLFVLVSCCYLGSLPFSIAKAEIIPDTTLPNNSIVKTNGNVSEITGGTIIEDKLLFHSFDKFSIPTGTEAYFNNPLKIENIFSRITGLSTSQIDGLIRANGAANLFILNPRGIIFGSNASLNIGGSFIGTTANSIQFADGTFFSAINPQAPPLLKVSVPIGLQFGNSAGDIVVQGAGNNLSIDFDTFAINTQNRPLGLQVAPGQTLALVGGNVSLSGGNLTATGGRIELGGVGAEGIVKLTTTNPGWVLNYENINNFQDIKLQSAASIDTSGNGGAIQIQGRHVSLVDGSAMLANTLNNGAGGTLNVRGSESVEVIGQARDNPFYGGIFTDVATGATGNGGNLTIETRHLLVADGTQISSGTFSSGNAGTLAVKAENVELIGATPLGASGLFAPVAPGVSGNGGDINIETGRLLITNGGQIVTSSFGFGASGNAGTLTIKASEVDVSGSSPGNSSGLFASVFPGGTGNAGRLILETGKLQVSNGGLITVANSSSGEAGELTIRASKVNVTGFNQFNPSLIETTVGLDGRGDGGQLTIETGNLEVANGGQIATGTFGAGNGGELNIRATEIRLIGATEKGRSGLFANALIGTGAGGDINIATNKLVVLDGATINASNFPSTNLDVPPGQGTSGNINVQANLILLDNQSLITAETLGDRGNINLQSEKIQILRGSKITTNARGDGSGGNIIIDTDFLIAIPQQNSDITANAQQSFAGRVLINAKAIFGTEFRSSLTPESDITASSEAGAEFNGMVQLNISDADFSQQGLWMPESKVNDSSQQIVASCRGYTTNRFTIVGRQGLPENPTNPIQGQTLWQDLRTLSNRNIRSTKLVTQEQISTIHNQEFVESQAWIINADGEVELIAKAPTATQIPESRVLCE